MERMNVKFQTLVMTTEWGELQDALIKLYPAETSNMYGYEDVYYELLTLEREKCDMFIHITTDDYPDDGTGDIYYNTHGCDGTVRPDDPDKEETYALEFKPWSEWLDMSIHYMTMEQFSNVDVLAHCMREMTRYGFDQEKIKERSEELHKTLDERMKSIEDGTAKLVSWEELKKKLKERFGFDEDRDDNDGEQRDSEA